MLAIINQKENSTGQGLVNSTLYTMAANSATYASAFHDITTGSNACTAGSSYCSAAGQSQYYATTGYDQASGLGSVDFYNLLNAWPSSTVASLAATNTSLSAATSSPSAGANDVITITVSPQSSSIATTPTGTLTVVVDGTTKTSSLALSSGTASYAFSSTTSGTHVITSTYSGDTTFAGSTGSATITIASSSSGSGSGGSGSTTVTVTPSGGYTGTVALSLYTSSTYLQNYACYDISNATVSSSSAVSSTLALYTGSANCSSASIRNGKSRAFRTLNNQASSNQILPVAKGAFVSLGCLVAGLVGWRSRRLRGFAFVFVLVFLGLAVSGCGGSSSNSKGFTVSVSPSTVTVSAGTSGIPTGTYSLQITGQDSSNSSQTASTTMTLVVN